MDDCDRAKIYERRDRAAALKAASHDRPSQPAQLLDEDGNVICLDCRDLIPEGRLQARPDAVRCVACKRICEQRGINC